MFWFESKGITAVLSASRNLNVSMHSDVYEPTGFKFGMMKDTTKVYILILVYLNFNGRPQGCEKKKPTSSAIYCTKLQMDLDGIWYAVEACWSDEHHTHFILSNQVCKGAYPK